MTPRRKLAWRPGILTLGVLVVNISFSLWVLSPTFWNEIGADSKAFYAAARLAQKGQDPYDPARLTAEEDALYNQPRHLTPGDTGYYAPNAFGYPPAILPLLALGAGLGEPAFYGVSLAVLLVALGASLLLLLEALGWQRRALPLAFGLASTPAALGLFVGNPSAVLLLGLALAVFLASRGRPFLAGIAAAVTLLKLPVGAPLCLALLLTLPVSRPRLSGGMAAGTLALGLLGLAGAGWTATANWLRALGGYSAALGSASPGFYRQTDLAGLPALLLDRLGPAGATAVALAAVLALAALILAGSEGFEPRRAADRWALPAAAVGAALAVSPYLHLNDLVLAALPLLVVASHRPGVAAAVALLAFFLLIPVRLVVEALLSRPDTGTASTAGIGVVLTALTLVAALMTLRRGDGPSRDASPAAPLPA